MNTTVSEKKLPFKDGIGKNCFFLYQHSYSMLNLTKILSTNFSLEKLVTLICSYLDSNLGNQLYKWKVGCLNFCQA